MVPIGSAEALYAQAETSLTHHFWCYRRPDRAIFAATSYVANALGRKFVEPPVLDLGETLGDATPLSPLIFVLSAGVDPTQILRKLALESGMGSKFFTVALGQGQVSANCIHKQQNLALHLHAAIMGIDT